MRRDSPLVDANAAPAVTHSPAGNRGHHRSGRPGAAGYRNEYAIIDEAPARRLLPGPRAPRHAADQTAEPHTRGPRHAAPDPAAGSPPTPPPAPPTPPGAAEPPTDDLALQSFVLVQKAQAGDSHAFAALYDRYVDTVFRFVYFRCGHRQTAEDLTGDTFFKALRRIGTFTWQGCDFGAWLITIARNLLADHFKSARYRLNVSMGDMLDADETAVGPEGDPCGAAIDYLRNRALLGAVKNLNPEQQEVVVLRYLIGLSVTSTAQIMDKKEGAVKALTYRAVNRLRRTLGDDFLNTARD